MRWLLPLFLMACDSDTTDQVETSDSASDSSTESGDSGDPIDDSLVTYSGVIACEEPSTGDPRFTSFTPDGMEKEFYDATSRSLFVGTGFALEDFNGDGLLDLFLTGYDAPQLFHQTEEGWVDMSDSLPTISDRTFGALPWDYDLDGDIDLFVTALKRPNHMLENVGDGTFIDVTGPTRLAGDIEHQSTAAAVFDVNEDGLMDLFVGGYGPTSNPLPEADAAMLYLNNGDGSFTNRAGLIPLDAHIRHTFIASFERIFDDQVDLYLVNDFGWRHPNIALRWTGEDYYIPASQLGLDFGGESMGLGIGDFNMDGYNDYVITAWSKMGLLESNASGWIDSSAVHDLQMNEARGQSVPWANEAADFNNDGWLDIYSTFGKLAVGKENAAAQPDALWMQRPNNNGTFDGNLFEDIATAAGVADANRGRSAVAVDINRDGFLDIIQRGTRSRTQFYINQCTDAAWLQVNLKGSETNPEAIGARVFVEHKNFSWQMDVRRSTTGYGAEGPRELHFGLGDTDVVDRVLITWPDGTKTRLENVETRQFVTIAKP